MDESTTTLESQIQIRHNPCGWFYLKEDENKENGSILYKCPQDGHLIIVSMFPTESEASPQDVPLDTQPPKTGRPKRVSPKKESRRVSQSEEIAPVATQEPS